MLVVAASSRALLRCLMWAFCAIQGRALRTKHLPPRQPPQCRLTGAMRQPLRRMVRGGAAAAVETGSGGGGGARDEAAPRRARPALNGPWSGRWRTEISEGPWPLASLTASEPAPSTGALASCSEPEPLCRDRFEHTADLVGGSLGRLLVVAVAFNRGDKPQKVPRAMMMTMTTRTDERAYARRRTERECEPGADEGGGSDDGAG